MWHRWNPSWGLFLHRSCDVQHFLPVFYKFESFPVIHPFGVRLEPCETPKRPLQNRYTWIALQRNEHVQRPLRTFLHQPSGQIYNVDWFRPYVWNLICHHPHRVRLVVDLLDLLLLWLKTQVELVHMQESLFHIDDYLQHYCLAPLSVDLLGLNWRRHVW